MSRLWPNGSHNIPRVTSEYGPRLAPVPGASTFHRGIDLVGWNDIVASQAGTATWVRYTGGAGNQVSVRHPDGTETVYMHLASFSVREGQAVAQGQKLGVMGATGNVSGKHVHFQTHTKWGSGDINPRIYIAAGGGLAGDIIQIISKTIDTIGEAYVKQLQLALGVVPDGKFGTGSIKALQSKVGAAADGIIGTGTITKLQQFIGAGADGIWGPETTTKLKAAIDAGKFGVTGNMNVDLSADQIKSLQAQLGVAVTGKVDNATLIALQKKIGTVADGGWGTNSIKALQTFIGVGADGIWGNGSLNAYKNAIAASKFGTPVVTPPPVTPPKVEIPKDAVFGIDVAYPQTGEFDWAKVKENYNFVFIKAAGAEDGLYGPATLLDKHLAGARSVGMTVGFYFFNNNRHPVKAQADIFIETLKPRIRPGDVIALDIEDVGSQPVQFNPAQALEFANYMEEALDIKTFMYLNRSSVNNADWSAVVADGHPLWLATLDGLENGLTYLKEGSVKWWGAASLVQFSSSTPIPGYPHGPVDQNICLMTDLAEVEFVAFPVPDVGEPDEELPDVEEPDEETPTDPDEVPSWFRRFLEGLMAFFKSFLGPKT